jgi:osmotically-inducible protein OsmY
LLQDRCHGNQNLPLRARGAGRYQRHGFCTSIERKEIRMRVLGMLLIAAAAALGTIQIGGCASSPEQRATGEVFDDGLITTRVKRELFHQEGVRLMDVDVNTYRGQVQLSGFVPSEETKRLAGEAARRVDGVRSVQNDIRIAPRD